MVLVASLDLTTGLLRGYRNSRTWGTVGGYWTYLHISTPIYTYLQGRQGSSSRSRARAREGRQQLDAVDNSLEQLQLAASCGECGAEERGGGAVCGTDGNTYADRCQLRQLACRLTRRQGDNTS